MEIKQGDIFWFDAGEPRGSSPAYSRPVVIIQNNVFNRSPLGKRKFEYEFDNQGNWIKQSHYSWEEEKGKFDWKLMRIEYRKIKYFDTK